jgi:superfamily II DNA or RNA helicase
VRAVRIREFHGTDALHEIQVEYLDNWAYPATDFVIWEVEQEHGAQVVSTLAMPRIDDERLEMDPPDLLRAFQYANQWSAVNQLSATSEREKQEVRLLSPWQGAIQVEDYQLYPVLKAMLMPRISMLLADDVGLGKTIEAGLILSELYVRRRIRRALIICPASLQIQWRDEMSEKFHLDFTIVDREETFRLQRELGVDSNPWLSYPRIITSMDYLRQEDILESFRAASNKLSGRFEDILPWQMLVVDEVHNLAPSRYGDNSRRCEMLRQISPWFEHRLFLSATPHNGYTLAFTGLLELLDPVRFQQKPELDADDHKQIALVMVRRLKSDLSGEGEQALFAERYVEGLPLTLYEPERALFAALQAYREALHDLLKSRKDKGELHLGEFLIKLLTKRLLSSSYAFARTWWQHVEGLSVNGQDLTVMEHTVKRAEEVMNDDAERGQREEDAIKQTGAWLHQYASQLRKESLAVSTCLKNLGWDNDVLMQPWPDIHMPQDSRWDSLKGWIDEHLKDGLELGQKERLIIFTEYKHTLEYLVERLRREYPQPYAIECLFGGATSKQRERVKEAFNDPTNPLRILVGTDTVSEGINLQATCRYVIHQDVPWNPMRMEQRNGRVDRHGQERDVRVYHFTTTEEGDLEFMSHIVEKVRQARDDLGSVGQVIDQSLEEYFAYGNLSRHQLDKRIDDAREKTKERVDLEFADRGRSRDALISSTMAGQRLEATEQALELSSEHVRMVLDRAARQENGALQKDHADNAYTFKPVPETWSQLIRETMVSHVSGASGRAKMVFDPLYFVKPVPDTERKVFVPRNDRVLVRLGHPVMQRAVGTLKRRMWDVRGDHKDLSRWTVQGYDQFSARVDAVLLLKLFLEITNEFREVAHQEVLSYAFQMKGNLLVPYDEDTPVPDLHDRFSLSNTDQDRKVPELRERWLYHDSFLRDFIDLKRNEYQQEFTLRMQTRRDEEEVFTKKAIAGRLKELDHMKEPRVIAHLKRENTQLEKIVVKAENMSLFSHIQQENEQAAALARQRIEDNEWRMYVVNVVDRMKKLIHDEQELMLKKVLPKRYTLAAVDIQPLTIEYVVKSSEERTA